MDELEKQAYADLLRLEEEGVRIEMTISPFVAWNLSELIESAIAREGATAPPIIQLRMFLRDFRDALLATPALRQLSTRTRRSDETPRWIN